MDKQLEKQLKDMLMSQYDLGINNCHDLIIQGFKALKEKGANSFSVDQIINIIENIRTEKPQKTTNHSVKIKINSKQFDITPDKVSFGQILDVAVLHCNILRKDNHSITYRSNGDQEDFPAMLRMEQEIDVIEGMSFTVHEGDNENIH